VDNEATLDILIPTASMSVNQVDVNDRIVFINDRLRIGKNTGTFNQSVEAIAIGNQAGYTSQTSASIAIGYNSGQVSQGTDGAASGGSAIAMGTNAGNSD
jgi:hypothetical protein